MDEARTRYDAIAGWYDAYIGGPVHEELVLPGMLDLAGDVAGLRLLDVACGQGIMARELARRPRHRNRHLARAAAPRRGV